MPEPLARVPDIAPLFLAPEQGVGRIAVGGGSEAMFLHPRDLAFEQMDPLGQLVLRKRREIFGRQLARRISSGPGTILFFHRRVLSRPACLLSITALASPPCQIEERDGPMPQALPATMTAMGFDAPGGPEVFRPETLPVPRPGPGQVLIKVAHAGVNRPDVIQRQGFYPPPKGASPIPGLEIAGIVCAIGPGVEPEMLNQEVCALVTGGGYAEYCLASARHCLHVPDGLSPAEAAALPETLFTVWHTVFERGHAREGEVLLVHGGTSGIGTMAIMLGKAFGLTVITTCGSEEKCDAARAIGADLAINYRTQDFVEHTRGFTDGRGADVVLDMVSGSYVARNIEALSEEGRHVTIAVLGGLQAEINMAKLMAKRLTLTGSTLRVRSDEFKALLADDIHRNVWPLVEEGALRPVMDRSFPLAEVGAAHARMEAGEHIGKIVLDLAHD